LLGEISSADGFASARDADDEETALPVLVRKGRHSCRDPLYEILDLVLADDT